MNSSANAPDFSQSRPEGKGRGGNSRRPGGGHGDNRGRGGRGRGGPFNSFGGRQGNGGGQQKLTHFISIPLGHIPALRSRIDAFTSSLLSTSPLIPGLDESIIIPSRRLHFTLGVMSLEEDENYSTSKPDRSTSPKTTKTALAHLQSLKEPIISILQGNPLRISLEAIDIMKPERNDPDKAHVMFVGPNEVNSKDMEQYQKLVSVCDMINKSFTRAGLVVDERRPLKLHCTLLNTVYRRPRPQNGRRIPFSYSAILASEAARRLASSTQELGEQSTTSSTSKRLTVTDKNSPVAGADTIIRQVVVETTVKSEDKPKANRDPLLVDLGTWEAHEIHICEMGSKGPEGEYVSVGKIRLTL